jgi:hypothetical protein
MSLTDLRLSVIVLEPNGKQRCLFGCIPTYEEADLLAQYAMS